MAYVMHVLSEIWSVVDTKQFIDIVAGVSKQLFSSDKFIIFKSHKHILNVCNIYIFFRFCFKDITK